MTDCGRIDYGSKRCEHNFTFRWFLRLFALEYLISVAENRLLDEAGQCEFGEFSFEDMEMIAVKSDVAVFLCNSIVRVNIILEVLNVGYPTPPGV